MEVSRRQWHICGFLNRKNKKNINQTKYCFKNTSILIFVSKEHKENCTASHWHVYIIADNNGNFFLKYQYSLINKF